MANERILVVEDETLVAEEICDNLVKLGYSIAGRLSSADEVMETMSASKPDLVLMDIRLEGAMDGIEAASKVRLAFGTPVIFLTAYSDEATLQRAADAAPSSFLVKPFNERELAANIAMTLSGVRVRSTERERLRGNEPLAHALGLPALLLDSAGLVVYCNDEALALLKVKDIAELRDEPLSRFVDLGVGMGLHSDGRPESDEERVRIVVAADGSVQSFVVRVEELRYGEGGQIGSLVVFDNMSSKEHSLLEFSASAINEAIIENLPSRKAAGKEYEVGGFLLPCPSGSGDLYDVVPVGSDRFCFFSIDVMGHGPLASLIAWSLRDHIRRVLAEDRVGQDSPAAILARVSQRYRERTFGPGPVFFSASIAIVGRSGGNYLLGRAGHPPAIVIHPGLPAEACRSAGRVIGISDELTIGEIAGKFELGSRLLLFSDGFLERYQRGRGGLETLVSYAEKRRGLPLANFVEAFKSEVAEGANGDDASLLVIDRLLAP